MASLDGQLHVSLPHASTCHTQLLRQSAIFAGLVRAAHAQAVSQESSYKHLPAVNVGHSGAVGGGRCVDRAHVAYMHAMHACTMFMQFPAPTLLTCFDLQ